MSEEPLSPDSDPRSLPPGTRLGPWRVESFLNRGVFGSVYRAFHADIPRAPPVALKIAIHPRDPRFERETTVLSRLLHPHVPRLIDSGTWRHGSGFLHPFIVMEWIDGEPLYSWSARRNPSSRQVLQLLAQGARALQATHAVNAVHRDVKGANVLVRPADGRLFLTDFGSSHYQGAERLTAAPVPPGTPAYCSPEVWNFQRHHGDQPYAHYVARPSDDVFAFGVMAYRLVTDEYPPSPAPPEREGWRWLPGGHGPKPPRTLNPRVDPRLSGLILRMLSLKPKDRGTPEELADALEEHAEKAGSYADVPLFDWESLPRHKWPAADVADSGWGLHRKRLREQEVVQASLRADAASPKPEPFPCSGPPIPPLPRRRMRGWRAWLGIAGAALMLWPRGTGPHCGADTSLVSQKRGSVSLGDGSLTSAESSSRAHPGKRVVKDTPAQLLPGQLKPDAKGRCPAGQTAINGGCWIKANIAPENCKEDEFACIIYRGDCFVPAFKRGEREPTSTPSK